MVNDYKNLLAVWLQDAHTEHMNWFSPEDFPGFETLFSAIDERKPYPVCKDLKRALNRKVNPAGEDDIAIGDIGNLLKYSENTSELTFNAYLFGYIRGLQVRKEEI